MNATRTRNINRDKKDLSPQQREELMETLKARFEKNMNRHRGVEWAQVQAKLQANAERLWSLNEMERTGGEPDVIGHDNNTGECVYCPNLGESNPRLQATALARAPRDTLEGSPNTGAARIP